MMLSPTTSEQAQNATNFKSPSAFRTIAEVASELDLPAHVLRFWESKFTQIKPLKRRGGRRYYRPEDVVLLRRIRSLLYTEGYTIKGVQRLLREGGAKRGDESGKAASTPDRLPPLQVVATDPPETIAGEERLRAVVAELEAIRRLLDDEGV